MISVASIRQKKSMVSSDGSWGQSDTYALLCKCCAINEPLWAVKCESDSGLIEWVDLPICSLMSSGVSWAKTVGDSDRIRDVVDKKRAMARPEAFIAILM